MARRDWTTGSLEAAVVLLAVGLAFVAGVAGWAIGHANREEAAPAAATLPAGHSGGANLEVSAIGDPAQGRELFVSKGCSDCHSYLGAGGSDAPPLDFMQGHLSATEIANMSGRIWDHLPQMLGHFEEEGIPVPTFQGDEMANLVAYLHSGEGGAPEVSETGMEHGETGEETTTGG